jgi:hypothetical protein
MLGRFHWSTFHWAKQTRLGSLCAKVSAKLAKPLVGRQIVKSIAALVNRNVATITKDDVIPGFPFGLKIEKSH